MVDEFADAQVVRFWGCLRAQKGACKNKLLIARKRAETFIVAAVSEQLQDAEHIRHLIQQVEQEIGKLKSGLPETMRLKEVELASQRRRLDNLIEFIAEGRGSKALGSALEDAECQVERLGKEVTGLNASREQVFKVPPSEWITERLLRLQDILEERAEKSALLLGGLLGPIRLEVIQNEGQKPFYRAKTAIDAISLIETPQGGVSPEGSGALRQRRASNDD